MRFFLTLYFFLRNRFASRKVFDFESDVDVSLTSYGERLKTVYLTIESIASGDDRPRSLFLFLSKEDEVSIPTSLKRLANRGLQIIYTRDLGPHTKYYPYLEAQVNDKASHDCPGLVTADDDKIYPNTWLRELRAARKEHPKSILCFRAREIKVIDGQIAPYKTWPLHVGPTDAKLFLTGVSGVLYPQPFLFALKGRGLGFVESCLKADDIWLNLVALRSRTNIVQIRNEAVEFPNIPLSSRSALHKLNVGEGGNDRSISALYTFEDVEMLVSAPATSTAEIQ